jgi:hypothetical protein
LGLQDHADPNGRFHLVPSLLFEESREYKIFQGIVLQLQSERAARSRRHAVDIPEEELGPVEGDFALRKGAAAKCRELLQSARADLEAEKKALAAKPKSEQDEIERAANAKQQVPVAKVGGLGITSAYRSPSRDARIWYGAFRKYYALTYSKRLRYGLLEGGMHGWKDTIEMVAFVRKRKAAPGFSNHSNGIAVDFFTVEDKQKIAANASQSDAALKAYNQRWERTWFYRWLEQHKAEYGIERIPTEAWHWEFRL